LLWANRNAFYYVLDRHDGAFVRATPYATQTWATGLDARGRPIKRPGSSPTPDGAIVYPGVAGATNWWSPSYDPRTRRIYVPTREQPSIFFSQGGVSLKRGEPFTGSSSQPSPSDRGYVAVRALDAASGELIWEHRFADNAYRTINGVLSTDGGLVFVGQGSELVALDAATGSQRWAMELGARVWAAPITYAAGGRQMVAVAAGRSLFAFALPSDGAGPAPRQNR
jgi:alcohol dehydrogenase (cytochrome c)